MAKAKELVPISNWNTMIQGLNGSTQDFYQELEGALAEKQVKGLKVSRMRIPMKPDGVSNREAGHRSDPKPDTIPI